MNVSRTVTFHCPLSFMLLKLQCFLNWNKMTGKILLYCRLNLNKTKIKYPIKFEDGCFLFYLFIISPNAYRYTVSLKGKCNVLCERTDNEASGWSEVLAVTLINIIIKHKNNDEYINTKNKVKIQSYIYKCYQIFFRDARLETRNRLGLNNIWRKRIPNWNNSNCKEMLSNINTNTGMN